LNVPHDGARSSTPPRVAVIIVAFNSGEHLQRALDGLAAQTYRDFEITLWDNASVDGAAERAVLPDNARYVRSEENFGFAGGNNRAVALTSGELIVLLNPDAIPEPEWLERLVGAIDVRADAVMAASLQLCADDSARLDGVGDVYHISGIPYRGGFGAPRPPELATGEVFGPCGAAALYRRAAFDEVGGFDERFFCYVEDVDLAFRLRRSGGRCVFVADAVVRHVGSATLGRRADFTVYHGTRNRLWTFVKNMPLALLPLAVPLHVGAVGLLLIFGVARRSGVLRASLRGLRDGVAGAGPFLAERRAQSASARASTRELARAMTWSPFKLLMRSPDVRPYRVLKNSGPRDHKPG